MKTRRDSQAARAPWDAAAQVVLALGEELSVDGLAARALEQLLTVFRADAAVLYLIDSSGRNLELKAQRGFQHDSVIPLAQIAVTLPCLTTEAARTGEPQLATNLADQPLELVASQRMVNPGYCSLAAIPLRVHGRTVGVLTCARRACHFDTSEMALGDVIAHALASGILNAQAFREEHRMRRALEAVDEATLAIAAELDPRRVLQAIVERARELAGARYAALGIGTDPDRQFEPWVFSGMDEEEARLIGPHPRPRGLLGAVVTEGKAIRVRNLAADPRHSGVPPQHPYIRSFMGVPIRARGESIGNLYLGNKIGAEEFSPEDQRAMETLAAHAAIAFRHAQLFEQAQAERSRLLTVVDNSPIGMIFIEKDSGSVLANRAAEELFGQSIVPSAGREQYVAQFSKPDGGALSDDELPSTLALEGESVVGVELVLQRPDGREIPLLVNAAPIRDAQGNVTGAVVIWQDISPLKLERLREEFISVVAHELRAPITVIGGYADLLRRKQQGEADLRAIESIRVSVRRLERLVQDLLDASRIEAQRLQLELRPLDLDGLVREVVDRLSEVLRGRTIEIATLEKPQPVEADTVRLEQVLTNLLTNAVKYSTPDTPIRVTVEQRPGEAVVSVANEGPGIAATDLARLFTRFYRTRSARKGKAEGIGLGLYIARGLVEAHGGRIWATSEPGKGTVFGFALPAMGSGKVAKG